MKLQLSAKLKTNQLFAGNYFPLQFVEWCLGVEADTATKAGDQGAAFGEAQIENIIVYQPTQFGLALQVPFKDTKYWKDPTLK